MTPSYPDGMELTHAQKQIWIGQRLHPESPLYNMAFAFLLPTELRSDRFQKAWRSVVADSDALRTRIVELGGRARRAISASGPQTETLDFSDRDDPESAFDDWCRARCARPLAFGGDLVDSVLVRLGPGRTGWYLNQHHLIADAWSTRLLVRSVGDAYAALLGEKRAAPESRPRYYPTAVTLAARGDERTQALEHWAARGERPGRRLPLYGRAAEPSGTASTRSTLELDESRTRALDQLSRQQGFCSLSAQISGFALFATLLTSWLWRLGGGSEAGFDAPVAGRPTSDAKRALGLFIELFPFAVGVEADDTFRSLGARCLEETMSFLRWALPGTSSPSGSAASSVVLNYFPVAFGDFAGLPIEAEWLHPGHGDSVHALRLQVHDFSGSGRYTLHFDGNDQALPPRLWRRGRQHFEKLLDACLADPDRRIATVDLLTDEERRALVALNATASTPLPERTVSEAFERRACLEPGHVALRQGREEITFSELRDRVSSLAAHLVARGIEPGDRVAILARRSTLAVVAIMAALRARAAYVPLDASSPAARVDHCLRDSGARLLLVGESIAPVSPPSDVTVVPIAGGIRAGVGITLERPGPTLADPAYLIYTSGSTGRPKGVLVEHGGLADYLSWASRTYVRGDSLAFPLFTSLAVDLTVTSLFLPLVTGGTLEIYPEPEGPVDSALMEVVAADKVDFIKLTPSHLAVLTRLGIEGSRIQRMVLGGENLPTSLAATASQQLEGRVEIYNEYGPTEAVVGCLAHRYDAERDTATSVPIGAPIDHVEIEILNAAGTPEPEGVPGELWVSRYGLARGYHGLEELTAQRFVESSGRPQRRRYRTGDRVRMVDETKLEYLGRLDRQLKVSGFRVEPAEIEAAMDSMPGVLHSAVVEVRRLEAPRRVVGALRHCTLCGLPSTYPRAVFDEEGVCSICRSYDAIKEHAAAYFKTEEELREVFERSSATNESEHDCMLLLSGGKDSTYALCRLVDMGLSVYAFTLDNGFISEHAKDNIRKVTAQLGVPVEFASTPAMNSIFRDSLVRFSNVCNGCFKTIYTLSMQRARELGIPIIVTGLSRGQMFETRLTGEMFRDGRCSPDQVDAAVLAARKVYHRVADEVSRSLDIEMFKDDRIFDEVRFVDFYRYVDVGLDEVYSYLRRTAPWVRPEDTGRSTNCLINDVGIWVHTKERGYHNYALPYSWDVRLGHKDRRAALEELDDAIDVEFVRRTLAEIGYDAERVSSTVEQSALYGFYVAAGEVAEADLRRRLGETLPPQLIPAHFQRVDSLPLSASGKVDTDALYRLALAPTPERPYRPPRGPVAEFLADLWQRELGAARVGADDSFFELGGTSLAAMEVMIRLCKEFDIELPLETLFTHPVLADLARIAEEEILADVSQLG